jgi:hypothetical protein
MNTLRKPKAILFRRAATTADANSAPGAGSSASTDGGVGTGRSGSPSAVKGVVCLEASQLVRRPAQPNHELVLPRAEQCPGPSAGRSALRCGKVRPRAISRRVFLLLCPSSSTGLPLLPFLCLLQGRPNPPPPGHRRLLLFACSTSPTSCTTSPSSPPPTAQMPRLLLAG